jgi:GTPase SAR1 family protein
MLLAAAPQIDPLNPDLAPAAQRIMELDEEGDLLDFAARVQDIKAVWSDPGIHQTFLQRRRFQFVDNAKYLLDRIEQVAQPGYVPSFDDMLRVRVRTTGVMETKFAIDNVQYKMVDVGGQRTERRKWIQCFQDVNAVLFVTAISEFDQMCFEDETTNRMTESLVLFNNVANNQFFRTTPILLFLNKRDLLDEKLASGAMFADQFPDFHGRNEVADVAQFIEEKFTALDQRQNKILYAHLTCATNQNDIKAVMNVIKVTVRKHADSLPLL